MKFISPYIRKASGLDLNWSFLVCGTILCSTTKCVICCSDGDIYEPDNDVNEQ